MKSTMRNSMVVRAGVNARSTVRATNMGNFRPSTLSEHSSIPQSSQRTSRMRLSGDPALPPPERALFVDVQEMKQKIKENISKKKYNVTDLYRQEGWAQSIARHPRFEQAGLLIIALNAIWIAVDTDYNKADSLPDSAIGFQIVEHLFCFLFLVEWIVRFLAFKVKVSGLRDGWFVFDGVLVMLMVSEVWVMSIVLKITGGKSSGGMGNASLLRLVRLLRLTRMARMARLLRAVPELMILIKGVITATRSVFFTLCLLVSIIYVFGIGFVQLTKNSQIGEKYFRTVPLSMFTLLLRGTYLDEITELMDDILQESVLLVLLFLAFVLLAAQTVTNMLIGVLCEVVSIVAATEKEEMMMTFVVAKMGEIMNVFDCNNDDHISKTEFVMMLRNQDATKTLQEVGVDAVSLVDFADVIFASEDGSEITLSFLEFMDIILQYRGSNTATVKDVVESQKIVRNGIINVTSHLKKLEDLILFGAASDSDNPRVSNTWGNYESYCCNSDEISSAKNELIQERKEFLRGSTKQDSLFNSEASLASSTENKSLDERTANFMEGLQKQMEAVQESIAQGHATMHQMVSEHLEYELHRRAVAEKDARKSQNQNSVLLQESRKLRDLLGNFSLHPAYVEEPKIKPANGQKNSVSFSADEQESVQQISRQGTPVESMEVATEPQKELAISASSEQTLQGSSLRASSGGKWWPTSASLLRPASGSSLRSSGSARRRQEVADNPTDDRLEFFLPQADEVTASPPNVQPLPNQADEQGEMQPFHVPRPADLPSPLPPETPLTTLPVRPSDAQRRVPQAVGQQSADREQWLNYWGDAE